MQPFPPFVYTKIQQFFLISKQFTKNLRKKRAKCFVISENFGNAESFPSFRWPVVLVSGWVWSLRGCNLLTMTAKGYGGNDRNAPKSGECDPEKFFS